MLIYFCFFFTEHICINLGTVLRLLTRWSNLSDKPIWERRDSRVTNMRYEVGKTYLKGRNWMSHYYLQQKRNSVVNYLENVWIAAWYNMLAIIFWTSFHNNLLMFQLFHECRLPPFSLSHHAAGEVPLFFTWNYAHYYLRLYPRSDNRRKINISRKSEVELSKFQQILEIAF